MIFQFQSYPKVPETVYRAKLWQNCTRRFVRIGRPTSAENNAEEISGGGANTSYRLVPFVKNYSKFLGGGSASASEQPGYVHRVVQ
jgi:hypothetical protein